MEVLAPHGGVSVRARGLAPRPASLAGLRIGVLDNSKPNAGVLLDVVAGRLAAQGGGSVRRWTKPGASRPATNPDEIAAASDVVLTASAD